MPSPPPPASLLAVPTELLLRIVDELYEPQAAWEPYQLPRWYGKQEENLPTRPGRLSKELADVASLSKVCRALYKVCSAVLWQNLDLSQHSSASLSSFRPHLAHSSSVSRLVIGEVSTLNLDYLFYHGPDAHNPHWIRDGRQLQLSRWTAPSKPSIASVQADAAEKDCTTAEIIRYCSSLQAVRVDLRSPVFQVKAEGGKAKDWTFDAEPYGGTFTLTFRALADTTANNLMEVSLLLNQVLLDSAEAVSTFIAACQQLEALELVCPLERHFDDLEVVAPATITKSRARSLADAINSLSTLRSLRLCGLPSRLLSRLSINSPLLTLSVEYKHEKASVCPELFASVAPTLTSLSFPSLRYTADNPRPFPPSVTLPVLQHVFLYCTLDCTVIPDLFPASPLKSIAVQCYDVDWLADIPGILKPYEASLERLELWRGDSGREAYPDEPGFWALRTWSEANGVQLFPTARR